MDGELGMKRGEHQQGLWCVLRFTSTRVPQEHEVLEYQVGNRVKPGREAAARLRRIL